MAHNAPAPTGKLAYQAYQVSLSEHEDAKPPERDWGDLNTAERQAWRYVAAILQLDAQGDRPDPEGLHA